MSDEPFDKIDQFCKTKHKNDIIRNIAFAQYQKQFIELVNKKNGATSGSNISDAEAKAIQDTLLSDGQLSASLRIAEDLFEEECTSYLQPRVKKNGLKSFWTSVLASIIASFLYSILLIIIFIIAQDQISNWLSSIEAK
ncbi:hypothetical protein QEH52_19195 [Coraliomargarita sp. SDUM461003]|uniref:Uncharacterized protein n=1 Tax=Thalassobacterium maritimum TaxID=3041265 RepID=A0ABU1AZT9_9BACT|nr:hypothetical protein [Coraliomargarita sp. SDUM461003]MDQ8209653.1 hypothetical protein [Coraliomargarita sp. SDUM461003]